MLYKKKLYLIQIVIENVVFGFNVLEILKYINTK